MTQDSSIKKSPANAKKEGIFTKASIHNGVTNFKHNMKLAVVLFVLHMAAGPLTVSMLITSIFSNGRADADYYAVIAVLTTAAAAAAGILCALSAMPYLYKKSVVDMRLSLPMTTLQRFVSDFLSGLATYTLPFIGSSIITMLLTLLGHILCDGKTFFMGSYDTTGWECHAFEEAAPVLIKGIIGGLALMLMFYTLTLLVSACCGSIFECVCYTILANGLIPGTIAVTVAALLSDVRGLVPESYLALLIPYTSPIGGCIGLVMALQNSVYPAVVKEGVNTITYGKWLGIFILVTLVLIVCTYLIYRKRKAEDTGNPIVYGALFHVIMTLGTACIVFAFCAGNGEPVPMVIITAIIYFLFSVIRRRGFKKFWRSALSYVLTVGVCLGSYCLVSVTDAFGATNYVPAPGAISAAYLDYRGLYEGNTDVSFSGFDFYGYSETDKPLKITDREGLEIVTDVHRMAAEENGGEYTSKDFAVMYRLKSGRTVIRSFSLSDSAIIRLSDLDMTDSVRQYRAEMAKLTAENLINTRDGYESDMDYNSYVRSSSVVLQPQWQLYDGDTHYHKYSRQALSSLPEDFRERLGECLYNDIMNETEEEYFRDPHSCYYLTVQGNGSYYGYLRNNQLPVRAYYKNTLDYLKSCGYNTDLVPDKTFGLSAARITEVSMVSTGLMGQIKHGKVYACTATAGASGQIYRNDPYFPTGYRTLYAADFAVLHQGRGLTDDLQTVMTNSYKQYKSDENCYTIIVNGNAAVIDPECNEAAERLFINMVYQEWLYSLSSDAFDGGLPSGYINFLQNFLHYYGREKIDAVMGTDDESSAYNMLDRYVQSDGKIYDSAIDGYDYGYDYEDDREIYGDYGYEYPDTTTAYPVY